MFFHALENSDPKLLPILHLLNPRDARRFDAIQSLDQYRLLIERLPGLQKCLEMDLAAFETMQSESSGKCILAADIR